MTAPMIERDSYITPDGVEYILTAPKDRIVFSWEGEGMPPIEYITQRGPFQHGETVLNFFLRPRILQAIIRHQYCNRSEYWTGRAELLNVLRPNRQTFGNVTPGRIRKRLANGDIRDLNVFIEQGPAFAARNPTRWDETAYQEVLRFIAHDPVWFNPTQQSEELTVATQTIAFRAAASANTNDSTSANIVIDKPTGTILGDLMIACITFPTFVEFNGVTAPDGWTELDGITAAAHSQVIYYKFATNDEPSSYTWTRNLGALGIVGIIASFSGVRQNDPFDVTGSSAATSATQVAPNITTTVANCMGMIFTSIGQVAGTWSTQLIDNTAATEPANGDKQNNASGTTNDVTGAIAYRAIGAAQAVNTNSAVCTTSGSGAGWIGAMAPSAFATVSITYVGNWIEYPTLIINGPIINPVIRNVTTGEKLELNITLLAGEYITIDLRYGVKTIIKSDGSNQIGTLSSDSDLATFHLAPNPEAASGVNIVTIASVAGDTGSLEILWYNRYIGV